MAVKTTKVASHYGLLCHLNDDKDNCRESLLNVFLIPSIMILSWVLMLRLRFCSPRMWREKILKYVIIHSSSRMPDKSSSPCDTHKCSLAVCHRHHRHRHRHHHVMPTITTMRIENDKRLYQLLALMNRTEPSGTSPHRTLTKC